MVLRTKKSSRIKKIKKKGLNKKTKKLSSSKRKRQKSTEILDYRSIAKKIIPVDELDIRVNAVLYGRAGTGKTTLAGSFPKPLLVIDCKEEGTDSIRDQKDIKVLQAQSWDEIEMIYWYLKKEKHKFKTVVWDTVSHGQTFCIRKVMEDLDSDIEEGRLGYWGTMRKQDWGTVSGIMTPIIIGFRDLPMNTVFVAHDRIFTQDTNEDEEDIIDPAVGPRVIPSIAATMNAAVGIIGNTYIRERYKKVKVKVGKKMKIKERRIIQYCLRIGPHAYYITKVRKPKSIIAPPVIIDPTYEKLIDLTEGDE